MVLTAVLIMLRPEMANTILATALMVGGLLALVIWELKNCGFS